MILTTSFQKVLESSTKVTQNCTGYLRLYLKYGNRNVATNTDTIYYEIRQYAYNPYGNYFGWEYSPSLSWSIKADNVTKASGSYKQSAIYSNGKEVVRASGSWTQPHNADGNWSANLTLSGYVYTTKLTKSGAVSLPLIPRKSSIAVTNGNIGSNTTIAIFSASPTFTHTLKFSVGSIVNSVIVEKTNQTSYLWNIPTSIYAQTPNSNSVIVTVSCETFSGTTSLGTTITTFSAYVTNSNPIYNKIVYDENTIAQELTGSNDIFIKDYSIAQINGTLTPVNNATLVGGYATQKITNGNQTLSNFSGYFDPVTSKTISFVMKDSRGNEPVYNSEYPTYTIANWVDYIKPSIRSIVVERTEQTSTEVTASLNGEYFHGSFGAVNNSIKYAWRYKLSSSSEWGVWSEYVPLETTSNYWYIDIVLGNEYDTKLSYDFQFKLVDEIGARDSTMEVLSQVQNVTVSTPIIEVYEDRFNVNGKLSLYDKEFKISNRFYSLVINSTGYPITSAQNIPFDTIEYNTFNEDISLLSNGVVSINKEGFYDISAIIWFFSSNSNACPWIRLYTSAGIIAHTISSNVNLYQSLVIPSTIYFLNKGDTIRLDILYEGENGYINSGAGTTGGTASRLVIKELIL